MVYVTSWSFLQEPELNEGEFAAMEIDDIKKLRGMIGKHIIKKNCEKDGNTYAELVIE